MLYYFTLMIETLRKKLHAPELNEVLNNLLQHAMMMCETKAGTLQLINKTNNTLEIATSFGLSEEFIAHFSIVTCDDGSVCGRALAKGETIFISDLTTDRLFARHLNLALQNNIRAVLSTPLISASHKIIGMISVHFMTPKKISKVSLQAFESFCRKAADKIEELTS
ncbi:MAG TPA: GAF domain-containing protein [Chitinophagaceae bacterium]|nr:GAF domain-containing protein [Chitinophagaceae bacterium]